MFVIMTIDEMKMKNNIIFNWKINPFNAANNYIIKTSKKIHLIKIVFSF